MVEFEYKNIDKLYRYAKHIYFVLCRSLNHQKNEKQKSFKTKLNLIACKTTENPVYDLKCINYY